MIKIVSVGKIKEKSLKELIEEYKKRISGYAKIEIVEVNDEPTLQTNSLALDNKVKDIEGERILGQIKDKDYVILLELKGKMINSVELANMISDLNTKGHSDLTFVIGGSLGVSDKVKKRANFMWQLSELTFPHQLCRLMLLEQIYRAYKINKNEPYHK